MSVLPILADEIARTWASRHGLVGLHVDDADRRRWDATPAVVLGPGSLPALRGWRAAGVRAPAVLLAARGPLPDRRAELEPLELIDPSTPPDDVLGRLSRRAAAGAIPVGSGVVDVDRRRLLRGQDSVALSQLQVDLLAYLAHRADRIVPREELLVAVWGMSERARTRTVDIAVSRLRRLVERDPDAPEVLLTCRGTGYRYVPPTTSAGPAPPAFVDALIGRDALVASAHAIWDRSRFVALYGPPGVGTSRVARAMLGREEAQRRRALWVDGTGLGAPVDAEGLLQRVAACLDMPRLGPESGLGAAERLADLLGRAGPCALVIDGIEGPPGPVLAGALELCTHAWALTTSTWRGAPDDAVGVEVPPLDREASLALFRARAARAGARLPADDAVLDGVIARADGLPLALELLAGRAASLPLAELAVDGDRYGLNGLRDTEAGRALAALAGFVGSFPLAAARAVLGGDAALDGLIARSLLQRDGDRYRVLGPVRQVAVGWATDTGPRRRWLVAFAAAETTRGRTLFARDALRALAVQAEDLEDAFRAACAEGSPDVVPLALALGLLQGAYGAPAGRLAVYDRALGVLDADRSPGLVADLLLERAFAGTRVDFARATSDADRGLELARAAPEAARMGWALAHQAWFDARRPTPAPERVVPELEAFIADHPEVPPAVVVLAQFQRAAWDARRDPSLRAGLIGTAQDAVERLLEHGDAVQALWMASAVAGGASTRGDPAFFARARHRLAELLELVPDRALEAGKLQLDAQAAMDEGQVDDALEQLERARQLLCGPRGLPDVELLAFRGTALLEAGRHEEAEDDLGRALGRSPVPTLSAAIRCALALSALDRGHFEHGLAHARAAVALDPHARTLHEARRLVALGLQVLGEDDAARAAWAEVDWSLLGPHPAQQVALAHAALARDRGEPAQVARHVAAVARYATPTWHSAMAARLAAALGDPAATGALLARPLPAALRVLARHLAQT